MEQQKPPAQAGGEAHSLSTAVGAGVGFQRYLALRVGLAAALPLLVIVLLLQVGHWRQLEAEYSSRVSSMVGNSGQKLELFLSQHVAAVESAAALISAQGGPASPVAGATLSSIRANHNAFGTMLVAGASGTITAFSLQPGLVDDPADPHNISDRAYFQVPMRENRSYVSEVFLSRGFDTVAIVAISAPVRAADGSAIGVVQGSLDLVALAALDPLARSGEMTLLILDQRSQVIYAGPGAGYHPMQSLRGSVMLARVRKAPPQQALRYSPAPGAGEPERIVARSPLSNGWEVLTMRRVESLAEQRWQLALTTVLLLLLAGSATVLVTWLLVRVVAEPVHRLAVQVANYEPGATPPPPPPNVPREVSELYLGFARMSARLNGTVAGLHHSLKDAETLRSRLELSLAEREQAIHLRTQELSERARELMASNFTLEQNMGVDALTGVANRRAFDEVYANSWRLALRNAQPISVIMMDIDHFKRYNDFYGHLKGDACLRDVAAAVQSVIRRPGDQFARYGGEEFVAVLMQTDGAAAQKLAETMRATVRQLLIKHAGVGDGSVLTASFGVASCIPDALVKSTELVALADDALYQSKRDGRDRVTVHSLSKT